MEINVFAKFQNYNCLVNLVKSKSIILNKKTLIAVLVFMVIASVDYAFRVKEMKTLYLAMKQWNQITDEVYESKKNNYEKFFVDRNDSWTLSTEDAFTRYVEDAHSGADSLYALKIELERETILPWHNSLQFAREDLVSMVTAYSEHYAKIYWEYDGVPTVKFPDSSKVTRTIEVSFNSYLAANPRPNPFFDAWDFDEQ